jgi:hypothetical protein
MSLKNGFATMADSGNCRITVHDDVRHRSSNPDHCIISSFTSTLHVSQPTLEMAFPAQKNNARILLSLLAAAIEAIMASAL